MTKNRLTQEYNRYPFAPHSEGVFAFQTDLGCLYTVEFYKKEMFPNNPILHNRGLVYEISVVRHGCDGKQKNDPCVCETIIKIVDSFISVQGDEAVYYFVCDFLDGKEKGRAKIFEGYGNIIMERNPSISKTDYILEDQESPDEQKYYVSLLLSKSHPEYENYIIHFSSLMQDGYLPAKNQLFSAY